MKKAIRQHLDAAYAAPAPVKMRETGLRYKAAVQLMTEHPELRYTEIARLLGCTRSRIQQIAVAAGLEETRKERYQKAWDALQEKYAADPSNAVYWFKRGIRIAHSASAAK
jgi:hypothetical protein